MKRFAGILFLLVFLAGCAQKQPEFVLPRYVGKENKPVVTPVMVDNLEDAVSAILDYSTADFVGHHPISEGFLFWVADSFGAQQLMDIAAHTDFSNPNVWYATLGRSIHVLWWEYCRDLGFSDTSTPLLQTKECLSNDEIVLDFCGDLTLADGMATTEYLEGTKDGLTDCFSDALLTEMRDADIFVVNNEFVFSTRGSPLSGKAYTFRAKPEYAPYLSSIGTDLVTLANNHVFDFGETGLLDTLDTLDGANICHIGAGRNLEEASEPFYFIANGLMISVCNATQIERSKPAYTREATENLAGVFKTLRSDKFCECIRKASVNSDYCIVSVHWGTEGDAQHGADQENLAKAFIGAGADAIIGGHTHCLQGIEFLGNVPVYYSLGNYYFSLDEKMPQDYDTGLARIRIRSNGKVSYEFVPCRFSKGVTSELTDAKDARKMYDYLESISETTVINDDGSIIKKDQ